MTTPPASETNPARIAVLSVSPMEEDHLLLEDILDHSNWTLHADLKWMLYTAPTIVSAARFLRENPIPVVVCERDLSPHTWIEMLEQITLLPDPPLLIVTSRLADERLRVEALNRGVYRVLAKPFDTDEVARSVSSAWLHWKDRHEDPARAMKQIRTAS